MSDNTKATSESGLSNRFAAIRERAASSAGTAALNAQQRKAQLGRFAKATEQDDQKTSLHAFNLTGSAIYQILINADLEKAEKQKKIEELLLLDFADMEGKQSPLNEEQQKKAEEIRAILTALTADYNEHNRECMRLTRDNPLSELNKSIKDVIDNYHSVVKGRADMKGKIDDVDQWIADVGGEKKLVEAIVKAKDKQEERDALARAMKEKKDAADVLSGQARDLQYRHEVLTQRIAQGNAKTFFWSSSERKTYNEAKSALPEATVALGAKRSELEAANAELVQASAAYETLTNAEEFKIHEKILEVLDIGGEEFKKQLTKLAEDTLQYVDDVEQLLTENNKQLEVMLQRTDASLAVNTNIGDKVEIMRAALESATVKNVQTLKGFKEKQKSSAVEGLEELSSLGERDYKKVEQAAHSYISDMDSAYTVTAEQSDQLQKLNLSIINMRDQIAQGLTRAQTHQVVYITTATTSGKNMLDGAQALASLVQSVIAEGLAQSEAEEAFNDGIKVMERSLLARESRISAIKSMSDLTRQMSSAMDESNDVTLQLSLEEKDQLERLTEAMQDLQKTAERKLGLDAEVHEQIALQRAAAPAAPGLHR